MNTYSVKISPEQAKIIENILRSKYNCVFDIVQYSVWRAKNLSFQAIYYTSGKLLIQGKDVSKVSDEIDSIIKNKNINECTNKNDDNIKIEEKYIGTDESGKGDFFGPLVIAGVQVCEENKRLFIELGIKDSKKLDDKKIKQLAVQIKNNAIYSVVVINPQKYNELYSKFNNLNKLLAWGHARAIENILDKSPCSYALADKFGDESLIKNALMTKGKNIILNQIVRAESDIAVAAASILARAEFVKRIDEMQEKFNVTLSKGASSKVVEEARNFVNIYSFERLNEVAKMHFKTVNEI